MVLQGFTNRLQTMIYASFASDLLCMDLHGLPTFSTVTVENDRGKTSYFPAGLAVPFSLLWAFSPH